MVLMKVSGETGREKETVELMQVFREGQRAPGCFTMKIIHFNSPPMNCHMLPLLIDTELVFNSSVLIKCLHSKSTAT